MKNKIMLKKTLCVFTACIVMTAGTGCRDKSGGENAPEPHEVMSTVNFDTKQVELNGSLGSIIKKNDLYYSAITGYRSGNDGTSFSTHYIVAFDENAVIKTVIPVYEQKEPDESGYISGNVMVDNNGNISCICVHSFSDNEGNYTYTAQLLTFDSSGKQISSTDLKNIITDEDIHENRHLQEVLIAPDGNIYCNLNRCVRVFDSTGKLLFTTKDIDDNSSQISNMVITNTGKVAVVMYENIGTSYSAKLAEVNTAAQDLGAGHTFKSNFNSVFSGSGEYIVYTSSDTGIMGVKADTMEPELIVNALSLGVGDSEFYACDDGSFLLSTHDESGDVSKIVLTTLTPPENLAEENSAENDKKIIDLGCFTLDSSLRSLIEDFNKNNSEYIINVQCFADNNDTTDWEGAINEFNSQLLSGNVPDIIAVNSITMPLESYIFYIILSIPAYYFWL